MNKEKIIAEINKIPMLGRSSQNIWATIEPYLLKYDRGILREMFMTSSRVFIDNPEAVLDITEAHLGLHTLAPKELSIKITTTGNAGRVGPAPKEEGMIHFWHIDRYGKFVCDTSAPHACSTPAPVGGEYTCNKPNCTCVDTPKEKICQCPVNPASSITHWSPRCPFYVEPQEKQCTCPLKYVDYHRVHMSNCPLYSQPLKEKMELPELIKWDYESGDLPSDAIVWHTINSIIRAIRAQQN